MANKYMKKCSPSLAMKEMQTKTTLRFYLTPIRIVTMKNTNNSKCWRVCGKKGTLTHCWWECKLAQTLWNIIWSLLKNLKIYLTYDPAIRLLGIYSKECDSVYYKSTCTPVFIVALFTTAKYGNSQDVPLPMNGLRKFGTYTLWISIQPQQR
jgi:hypothetical protein